MKFYVAGKWQGRSAVQQVQRMLIARRHTITVDWTNHTNPEEDSMLQEWAIRDVEGVLACDTYIGLFTGNHYYTGALVEMGVALGLGKRVWVIGNGINACIFLSHPLVTKFPTVKSMLRVLDTKTKEG